MPATVAIYTDGACIGNPGPGGFAGIILIGESRYVIKGGEARSTNSRMEIRAVTESISYLDGIPEASGADIVVHSDSRYVVDAFNQDWLSKWRRNGWRTSKKQRVKNQDLWRKLYEMTRDRNVFFRWVAGHSHDHMNNLCDRIARNEAEGGGDAAGPPPHISTRPHHTRPHRTVQQSHS